MKNLTADQRHLICTALKITCGQWEKDKKAAHGWDRLERQFQRQIDEAEEVIDLLENDDEEGD